MTLTLFSPYRHLPRKGRRKRPCAFCTEACTEEAVNHDCPVCGAEGAQACACEEVIAVDDADDARVTRTTLMPPEAPDAPDDVKKVHTVKDPSSADTGSDADDAKDTDDAGSTDAVHSHMQPILLRREAAVLNVTYTRNFLPQRWHGKYGQIFNVKNEITITQLPTRDGCDFIGWADTRDAAEAQYQPGTPIIITEGTEKDCLRRGSSGRLRLLS